MSADNQTYPKFIKPFIDEMFLECATHADGPEDYGALLMMCINECVIHIFAAIKVAEGDMSMVRPMLFEAIGRQLDRLEKQEEEPTM